VTSEDEQADHTRVHHLRATRALWKAYGQVVKRQFGTDRAPHLVAYMRRTVARYGDAEDLALLRQDRAETKARRARKGGRPPRRDL
jgi:hypothetical protein